MATLEAGLQALYSTLNPSLFPGGALPGLYLTRAPQVTAQGSQLRPASGYVVFALSANAVEQGFEDDIETTDLTVTALAGAADKAKQIVIALRFNGGTTTTSTGFDNCQSLPGMTDGVLIGIFPTRPPELSQEPQPDQTGNNVFRCVMRYRVLVDRS